MRGQMTQARFRVEHIGIAAQNSILLKDWYVSVLGARVLYDNLLLPPAFVLELGAGTWLEIYPAARHPSRPLDNAFPGIRHLALRVDSLEAARIDLAARGVHFPDPIKPAGGGGRVLFFRDPEANLLHLVERPPDSSLHAPCPSPVS